MEKIVVAGIPVHLFTVSSLHQTIKETIETDRKRLFMHANARLIELANNTDVWLKDFFSKETDFVMCDGAGIKLAAKITGQPVPEKIAYNIWTWQLLQFSVENNFSLYLLGSDQETLKKTVLQIKAKFPLANIAGYHHGYFNKDFRSDENKKVVSSINNANADILLVGFGMPVQERWVKENYQVLSTNCIFTCGGAFDFISGKNWVAPYIVRKLYLEWLFRLILEPFRLFSRATSSNYRFLKIVFKNLK